MTRCSLRPASSASSRVPREAPSPARRTLAAAWRSVRSAVVCESVALRGSSSGSSNPAGVVPGVAAKPGWDGRSQAESPEFAEVRAS